MNIDDYFSALLRGLRRDRKVTRIDEPFINLASDDFNGLIRCRVVFWDDSFLDIYEVVSTELGYPVRIQYAYTYIQQGERVFRYDNAPHHPEIVTHPHHKHIGRQDKLMPADQPGLSQIFSEIEEHLKAYPK